MSVLRGLLFSNEGWLLDTTGPQTPTLSSQINGQMEAGFLLSGFYEDDHPSPRFLIEKYIKTMIATRAIRF